MGNLFGETNATCYDSLEKRLVRRLVGAKGDVKFHNDANNGNVNYFTLCSTLPRLIDGSNVLRLLLSLCWLQFPSHRVSSAHRVNSTVNTIGRRVVLMLANGLMQDHETLIQRLGLFCSVVCFGQQCLCYKTT